MSAREVLVLQHVAWERPGLVATALDAAGVTCTTRLVAGDPTPDLPDPRRLAGLVVMGGPMNADDDARHPGLAAERALLARAVEADVPVLGICLGMQLLARALGAAVHAGHGTELGFAPVDLLADDAVLAGLGPRPTVLHWHSDAVELPAGATLLAASPATPVQAFRAGSAVGLQFHLEVDAPLLAAWLREPAMTADLAAHGVTDLPDQAARVLPGLERASAPGLAAFAAQAAARA